MRMVLQPSACPQCGSGLTVPPARPARWRPVAVLIFAFGCVISGMLLIAVIPYAGTWAARILRLLGYGLPRGGGLDSIQWLEIKDFLGSCVVFPIAVPLALIPAYVCGRIGRGMARRAHLECPQCPWRGVGLQRPLALPRQAGIDRKPGKDEPVGPA
jgi:hypothetical protein